MRTKPNTNLDEIFLPGNVALIGASPTEPYMLALRGGKLRDRLFLVNPNYDEILGGRSYKSILDIEEPVDYAVIVVPSRFILKTVRECIAKGLKAIHIYSSGFNETGSKEGAKLEEELAEMISGKIRLIGPNCMGVYCPKSGLSFNPSSTHEEGNIGVISQSGTFAQFFIQAGRARKVGISKVVSYGNAVDLDCPEFLDYLADDPDTGVIAFYVEGISDGEPLKKALENAASKKPVIALKGGITEQGGRVVSSHTGALAGSGRMWEIMFKQAGVLLVDDFESLLDTTLAFSSLKPPAGNGVSIITFSGGFSVVQSDLCIKAGLDVPQFSPTAIKKLREIVPLAGTMIGNPLDSWQLFNRIDANEGTIYDLCKIIGSENQIHTVVLQMDNIRYLPYYWGNKFEENYDIFVNIVTDSCRYVRDEVRKLILISLFIEPFLENEWERNYYIRFKKICEEAGFPVFTSLKSAINTAANMNRYVLLQ